MNDAGTHSNPYDDPRKKDSQSPSSSKSVPSRKSLLTHHQPADEKEGVPEDEAPILKSKAADPELKAPRESKLKPRSFGVNRPANKPKGPPPSPTTEPKDPEPRTNDTPTEDTPTEEIGAVTPKAQPAMPPPPGPDASDSSTGLSSRMADISSGKSPGRSHRAGSSAENAKATSSLPETLARLWGKVDEDKRKASEREAEAESGPAPPPRAPARSIQMAVDDPEPGWKTSAFWFVFCFGRYANGAMLAQPVRKTLLSLLVCAFGTLLHTMKWLAPSLPGPGPVFETVYLVRVFGFGMAVGLAFYVLLSLFFNLVVRSRFGRVGLLFGLRGVVHAFLPLALVQGVILLVSSVQLGEAFWRGVVPEWLGVLEWWVLPALWVWGGLRLAQAVCRLVRLPFLKSALVLTLAPLGALAVVAPFHPALNRVLRERREETWETFARQFAAEDAVIEEPLIETLERSIPFTDVERRRRLSLMTLELYSRRGEIHKAREESWRLDRLSPTDSAYDHVAKGLNLLLLDRPEMAVDRLERALRRDPGCTAAHHWLALYYLRVDPEKAEAHARAAFEQRENVLNLNLLVGSLGAQDKYREIWDVMLEVDAAPFDWHTQTLRLGARAADELGNEKRAKELREIAERKSTGVFPSPSESESD